MHAVILALVQGVTEFLPVSSSGHLVIVQRLLPGFEQPGILLDVMLHFGTLLAVVIFFRRDIHQIIRVIFGRGAAFSDKDVLDDDDQPPQPGPRLILGIVLACAVTAPVGLLLEGVVAVMYESVRLVGSMLLITAVLLALADWLSRGRPGKDQDPGPGRSLIIGLAQGLAVLPGISRSGATICIGMLLGVSGPVAARFSFLISLPAVGGATLYQVLKHRQALAGFSGEQILPYVLGPLVAAISGYFCIRVLMWMVRGHRLSVFAVYCALAGCLSIWLG